nr:putative nucleotidyltransferase, ribonuclease H [Tanacetum cinerariifolium]
SFSNLLSTTLVNLPIEDDYSPLLAYVEWIFVAYLTYPVIPPYLHPFGNEDTIFDPGITSNHFYSSKPGSSHRHGAFKKFNTHRSHLNEWPMTINDNLAFKIMPFGLNVKHLNIFCKNVDPKFEDRLCVPSDQALREKVMTKAHSSPFTVHPEIRGLRLIFGRDYRKLGELGLSSVQHFILKPMDEYLCFMKFAYNNSWHASIKASPFKLLYGRKCRVPICWNEVGERLIEGPELIEITNEKVAVAKEKLKEARSRHKIYDDKHRRKLSPRFIGPFEILERIGEVSYRLALPPQLSHVHDVFHVSLLKGYHYHPLHITSYPFDQIQPDMSLSEEP